MRIRDEELVEFLLGDADPALRLRVEQALAVDPRISKRLEELRAALGLLDSLKLNVEPPSDLISRTMTGIDADIAADSSAAHRQGKPEQVTSGINAPRVELRRTANAAAIGPLRSSRQLWDSAILSMSIVAMCSLILPVILTARAESRRLQCSYNLKSVGRGLTMLAMTNSERRFPTVPSDGPQAFTGIIVAQLQESGQLESPLVLKCPSLAPSQSGHSPLACVPTRAEYCNARPETQAYWRFVLGGDIAFPMGVMDGQRAAGAQLQGRSYFALLSDAPRFENDEEVFEAHDGHGINVFYEDGHVAFLAIARVKWLEQSFSRRAGLKNPAQDAPLGGNGVVPIGTLKEPSDALFHNIDGQRARGLNRDDAVLAPGYARPRSIDFSKS